LLLEAVERRFREVAPAAEFVSLRFVAERDEAISFRRDVAQPVRSSEDIGVMITVQDGGGIGYGATCDLGASGLRRAAERAQAWARRTAEAGAFDPAALARGPVRGAYRSAVRRPWRSVPLSDKLAMVEGESRRLGGDPRVLDWFATLWWSEVDTLWLTLDGSRVEQRFEYLLPMLSATANTGAETQTRTFGGHAWARQGGLEVLDEVGFFDAAPTIGEQAVELLFAPNCPGETCDLVLEPDQMIIQIHESIGHPLELDRILGDERNYAGTSFVTLDMLGSYRYGSDLLNVTFDPTCAGQLASYAFDDDGRPATREYLIREGILLRPLGGARSQARAEVQGVANARASGWNRPPIDRMANLNLEPGDSTPEQMIRAVERGVLMQTNRSWSIDDSRNKFQFSCERGRLIRDGELREVVKNPGYRGISARFWRGLAAVGDPGCFRVLGTPNCGKGEPNQAVRVGHAAPTCLFTNVDVFGGA
jgi:predicted Zn-dependent protease